ncbi:branched-chain amino acid ABC transporter permease [Xaviernesmea oryzae]|uniref:Branched-chain amino acid transport system permease protein n=1 Tax=Xaviernesmea oryzae TaxID=464029 RepID=A0A1X7DL05_9HYPH|nr:branched-chain amino acid ABC transporter permease [Xaviernesmea oryzae]SMF17366.1 branched-chain amino acid transport system permease protein [Xaviernesmea oryzae]
MTSHATISIEPAGIRWQAMLPVVAVVVVAGFGLLSSDYVVTVLGFAFIYTIFCTGLNFFMGYTGQASFGQSAFAAIGGYGSAILCADYGWEPLLALFATMALSGVAAVIVGFPTLRLRGHYLAMATFALGLIVYEVTIEWTGLTQGYMGYSGIPPLGIAGYELVTVKQQLVALVVLALFGVAVAARLRQSRFGRALASIAGSESAALALGVDIARYKLVAFVIAALYASAAGSLFAHFIGFISPEVFGVTMVVQSFAMLYLGGIGTMWGPTIGAIIVSVLPEALRGLKEMQDIGYTAILIFILIFAPRGLAGLSALFGRVRGRVKEAA